MTRGWFLPLVMLIAAGPIRVAVAHSFEPAVLDVRQQGAGVFDVIWKLPGPESGSFMPNDPLPEPVLPAHCRRVAISGTSAPHLGEPLSWRVDCGALGLRSQQLAVTGLGPRLEVIVRVTWTDGESASGVLHSGAENLMLPADGKALGSGLTGNVLLAYGRAGIQQFLCGADHLLFVLGLLLLVESGGLLVKTISAFTLAHSLGLALAGLGVVQVPPALVEALIALSIVLIAFELTRTNEPPTFTMRYPWGVAFGFGWLHGLGFAAALTAAGLPRHQVVPALFGFNAGIEIGQLLFVVTMLAPRRWLRRAAARWALIERIPAYAIGSLAVAWMLEGIGRFWVPLS